MAEHDVQPGQIQGSGKDGRITKDDVLAYIESNREKSSKSGETKKEQTHSSTYGFT